MLSAECIELPGHVLAPLVIVQRLDAFPIKLSLCPRLVRLESSKCVTLGLQEGQRPHPGRIVDEGDPVAIALRRQDGHLM